MYKRLFTGCMLTVLPLTVWAGGSHSDAHHDHDAPTAQSQDADHHDSGHGHAGNGSDHHGSGDGQAGHVSSVGGPTDSATVDRNIEVDLLDTMRFEFDGPLDLKQGEVVRFVVTNRGKLRHEFSIGSEAEQSAHRRMMIEMPDMVHEDANTVTVELGETRELIWQFDGENLLVFACNIPGHSEAGMVAEVKLRP